MPCRQNPPIRAAASAGATEAGTRATIISHFTPSCATQGLAPSAFSMLALLTTRRSNWSVTGSHTSTRVPTLTPLNPLGAIPTMVSGVPFTRMG